MNKDAIRVENLVKRYGSLKAVDDVSFTVIEGEVFGILGPNGAGKTTTVEILEGMRTADSGHAYIHNIDVTQDPKKVKAFIGVQLQTTSYFDGLNLLELLEVMGSLYHRKVNALDLLEEVELTDKAKARFHQLSGGQKQRFSIAAAIVNNPTILFLDEPTTGLDPQARRHMWGLIERLRDQGRTILLSTHYMEEAEELCNRVAIMDRGQIVALNTPDHLVKALLDKGFRNSRPQQLATLEDVFLDLTGKHLREE